MFRKPSHFKINIQFHELVIDEILGQLVLEPPANIPFSDLRDEVNELAGEINRLTPYQNNIYANMERLTLQN